MLLRRNAKCYKEKSYHYQIYHRLKVKPSFHEKLFQKEKNKLLLWIYARWLSSHLWFNGRRKSSVAVLSWNPCTNLRYIERRIWPCVEPAFGLIWMKLCSIDNHYTSNNFTQFWKPVSWFALQLWIWENAEAATRGIL